MQDNIYATDNYVAPSLDEISIMERINRQRAAIQQDKIQRACISAISQRAKENAERDKGKKRYEVKIWHQLAQIRPVYEGLQGNKPPSREGQQIHKFTKRSRQRLMQKGRKINYNKMKLPYFVTLTYRTNFTNAKVSKSHLNAFLQRFRRMEAKFHKRKYPDANKREISAADKFNYIWKLEFQARGAIHYHLAIFMPTQIDPGLNKMRFIISKAWAEITRKVNNKDGNLWVHSGLFADADADIHPDHIRYGTNVRKVDNMKMFLGYLFKYMSKEQNSNIPANLEPLQSTDCETQEPEYLTQEGEIITLPQSGRYWAFSRGFDFSVLFNGIGNAKEGTKIADAALKINDVAHARFLEHLETMDKADLEKYGPESDKYIRNARKRLWQLNYMQKRYFANIEKILNGYFVQFEIDSANCIEIITNLKLKVPSEYFKLSKSDLN